VDNHSHRIRSLWAVIVFGVAYSMLLFYLHTITGKDVFDGMLSITIGLFICAPAAMNIVDMIYIDRSAYYPPSSTWSSAGWLTLNIASILTGWIVIVIGLTRL
jgi:hypothetical protein